MNGFSVPVRTCNNHSLSIRQLKLGKIILFVVIKLSWVWLWKMISKQIWQWRLFAPYQHHGTALNFEVMIRLKHLTLCWIWLWANENKIRKLCWIWLWTSNENNFRTVRNVAGHVTHNLQNKWSKCNTCNLKIDVSTDTWNFRRRCVTIITRQRQLSLN